MITLGVVFEVCIQHRYKLNKKYRKLENNIEGSPDDVETKALISQAKVSKHKG